MSSFALIFIGLTVFATSFLSGIFGMAGGMILLGVLLIYLDVAQAMVIFGLIQMAANGWRAFLWRAHIHWRTIGGFLAGALVIATVLRFVAFLPSKLMIYFFLGLIPLLIEILPKRLSVDITKPFMPFVCGFSVTGIQFVAGAAGHILDQFFQKSPLDRKVTVATKAASQVIAHLLRVAYFGSFAGALDSGISPLFMFVAIGLSMAGTTVAAKVLEAMSDTNFKLWSRRIVLSIALFYILRAMMLLV